MCTPALAEGGLWFSQPLLLICFCVFCLCSPFSLWRVVPGLSGAAMYCTASSDTPPFSPFITMDSVPFLGQDSLTSLLWISMTFSTNNMVVVCIDMHLDTTSVTQTQGLILFYYSCFPFKCLSPWRIRLFPFFLSSSLPWSLSLGKKCWVYSHIIYHSKAFLHQLTHEIVCWSK